MNEQRGKSQVLLFSQVKSTSSKATFPIRMTFISSKTAVLIEPLHWLQTHFSPVPTSNGCTIRLKLSVYLLSSGPDDPDSNLERQLPPSITLILLTFLEHLQSLSYESTING